MADGTKLDMPFMRKGDYIGIQVEAHISGNRVYKENVSDLMSLGRRLYFRNSRKAERRAERKVRDLERAAKEQAERERRKYGLRPNLTLVRDTKQTSVPPESPKTRENVIDAVEKFEERRRQAEQPQYINVLQ